MKKTALIVVLGLPVLALVAYVLYQERKISELEELVTQSDIIAKEAALKSAQLEEELERQKQLADSRQRKVVQLEEELSK
jgi:hypothetical protein